ncbi:MAG: hypothetical protein JW837_07675 [Sedimentisphaerales bacterium]|nr:hypothetical protein [Sedimentisphaerales bacterium]
MVNIDDYFLPRISIKTDVSPYEFLVRMGEIAEEHGGIGVHKNYLSDKSFQYLTLLFTTDKSKGLENLCGMFTISPRYKERVWAELSSKSWAESGPKYEQYVGLVERYLKPLLSMYNKKYNTNRRFRIPSKDSLEPKLSECAARLFKHFVDYANKTFLSRYSWVHFYEFIIYCHCRNERLGSKELEYLLKKAEFNDFYCEKLCSIFDHGWDLLEQLPESKLRAFRKKIREQEKQEQEKSSNNNLDT